MTTLTLKHPPCLVITSPIYPTLEIKVRCPKCNHLNVYDLHENQIPNGHSLEPLIGECGTRYCPTKFNIYWEIDT